MAINCKLYNFSKRHNSTKIPGEIQATETQCVLKDNIGIVNPSFIFSFSSATNVSNYNYAYIPEWGRYYFIEEWSWGNGRWFADMKSDPMASFRDEINNSEHYILRTSSGIDPYLSDSLYPTRAGCRIEKQTIRFECKPNWQADITAGSYVIGIINSESGAVGSVSYYVFNNDDFRELCGKMLSDPEYLDIEQAELSYSLQKVLFDPFQYIVSCKWFPFKYPGGETQEYIDIGWWRFAANCKPVSASAQAEYVLRFPVIKHPQEDLDKRYLNYTPYTACKIFIPTFGEIDIPPELVYEHSEDFPVTIYIDAISGRATAVMGENGVIGIRYSDFGVPIQLSSTNFTNGYLGKWGGLATGAVSAASALLPKDGVFSDAGIAANMFVAANMSVSSIGENGGVSTFAIAPYIKYIYTEIADTDNSEMGSPYCGTRQLSGMGFVICAHGDFESSATPGEYEQIKQYLESGAFIE